MEISAAILHYFQYIVPTLTVFKSHSHLLLIAYLIEYLCVIILCKIIMPFALVIITSSCDKTNPPTGSIKVSIHPYLNIV